MSIPVSLITPSYARDFELCKLLCETVDAYVSGFDVHYIVVPDDEVAVFAKLERPHRHVVAESEILPRALHRLPVTYRGRRYYWMAGALPVYGWHTQQLRKFAMATAQDSPRVMFLDSDNVFVRPFDVAAHAGNATAPLYRDPAAIGANDQGHSSWLRSAHRLLGLEEPAFPAHDYIGQMIVWDVETLRHVLARVERTMGINWAVAMLRQRQFSEYMVYGVAVAADAALAARHHIIESSPCLTYWQGPALDASALSRFTTGLAPSQSAIAIQSFTRTPLDLLREVALGARAAA